MFLYSLHVLNRDVNMIKTNKTMYPGFPDVMDSIHNFVEMPWQKCKFSAAESLSAYMICIYNRNPDEIVKDYV